MVMIALSGESRKIFRRRLRHAYASHPLCLIQWIHALVELAPGKTVSEAAELLGIGEQAVRDWLRAFVLNEHAQALGGLASHKR